MMTVMIPIGKVLHSMCLMKQMNKRQKYFLKISTFYFYNYYLYSMLQFAWQFFLQIRLNKRTNTISPSSSKLKDEQKGESFLAKVFFWKVSSFKVNSNIFKYNSIMNITLYECKFLTDLVSVEFHRSQKMPCYRIFCVKKKST